MERLTSGRLGTTISAFVNLLAVLEQNPGVKWKELLGGVEVQTESNPDLAPLEEADPEDAGDELASFKL